MINTPPSERPQLPPTITTPSRKGPSDLSEENPYAADISISEQSILMPPSDAHAAVALAQLHGGDSDYEGYEDSSYYRGLPSIHDTLPPFQPSTRELLPSVLPSPTGRYTSLPPIQRRDKKQRPRKPSVAEHARAGKHERDRSKDFSLKEFSRRLSEEGRKAMSAEPPTAAWMQGKRWEDLIEAATSATEADDDRDLTPMPQSPKFPPASTGPSAAGVTSHAGQMGGGIDGGSTHKRSSLPPGFRPLGHLQLQPHHSTFNASPLQQTLTPPPPDLTGPNDPEPFPTVESIESAGSGHQFHIPRSGLPTSASSNEDTSPLQYHSHPYQHSQTSSFGSKADLLEIYCANCGRPVRLVTASACTECICGVCSDCVGQIISSPVIAIQPGSAPMRRGCPRCGVMGGKWKRFQLDFR
ncbi:hypothetical protein LTR05_006188 [Lithohypha guttulata]|uniref:RING zinc finger-like domain-containing protein n=1 Tax=Lithohypha guttulata TaxID=1690604 RepID=A0AAN7SXH6_9EURO|nr:hypothetical protein LTR05_006188 [Lithohypha guttulata]